VIRKPGISEQTFYRWKARYAGLEVDPVRQMAQLQEPIPTPIDNMPGLTPTLVQKLNAAGISTVEQLANLVKSDHFRRSLAHRRSDLPMLSYAVSKPGELRLPLPGRWWPVSARLSRVGRCAVLIFGQLERWRFYT